VTTLSDSGRPVLRTLQALAPGRFPYWKFLAALLLGLFGGWAFARLALPLPWMLGAMTACTLAAILHAPIAAPGIARPPMTMILGVMLGTGFTPDVLGRIPGWLPTLLGLFVFVAACGLACVAYFRRVGGFDLTTAYFAGMPGGLVEMVTVGEEKGADARTVALVHSARILLIVFTLPFLIQLVEGVSLGPRSASGVSIADAPWTSEAWLIGAALAGALIGHVLRLPAKYLVGPMLVSAGIHVSGVSEFVAPREIVNGAQVVLGTVVGCRFVGTPTREILRILALSLGSTFILLSLTGLFGFALGQVSPYGMLPVVLAYSPGGLAEMSLVALAIHADVAFVATHHIARVLIVMLGAAPVFALVERRRRKARAACRKPHE
jgi:uncharacterized protein